MYNILNDWGISTPQDHWYPEYLQEHYPENFFFIDKFPFIVSPKNARKFDQVDVFYQEVLQGKADNKDFVFVENKYIEVITKLWLYNDVFVEIDISDVKIEKIEKQIDKSLHHCLKSLLKKYTKTSCLKITKKNELKLLVQLACRDVFYVAFCFKNFQILAMSTFSCFALYINDLTKKSGVEKIVNVEGLYLRAGKTGSE